MSTLKRLPILFTLIFALGLTGCADDIVELDDCTQLAGEFEATNLLVRDAGVVQDFGDATLTLTLGTNVFTAEFVEPGLDPVVATGPLVREADALTFTDAAFIPGAAVADQTFACEVDEDGDFFLTNDTFAFDIDDDDEFDETVFEAGFVPVI